MAFKQIGEKEYRVGDNHLYLGDDNIIYIHSVGIKDVAIADGMAKAYAQLVSLLDHKALVIVDANQAGKPSAEAREIFQKSILKHEKTGKFSIHGSHVVARTIANFFIGKLLGAKMQFFKTEEEALSWLKQE